MSYRFKTGFTLIEMLVVIAIFGIVTTVILANLPVFRDRSSLDLVAQEVAINIRGAQVFGASGRVQTTIGRPTYGIHFDPSNFGPPSKFYLFRDLDDSESFNQNCSNPGECELEQTYTLSNNFVLDSICYEPGGNCDHVIDLLFTRPNLEPKFIDNNSPNPSITEVRITVKALRSLETRVISVWNNGQISVAKPTTP